MGELHSPPLSCGSALSHYLARITLSTNQNGIRRLFRRHCPASLRPIAVSQSSNVVQVLLQVQGSVSVTRSWQYLWGINAPESSALVSQTTTGPTPRFHRQSPQINSENDPYLSFSKSNTRPLSLQVAPKCLPGQTFIACVMLLERSLLGFLLDFYGVCGPSTSN